MGFTCAPNAATPNYVSYGDLRSFVAYGLTTCWLGSTGKDVNEDCHFARPVTTDDVDELRGYFLDVMETLIGGLWKGDFEKGQGEIEGDYQTLIIGNSDENPGEEEVSLGWRVRLDNDTIMVEFADGGDGVALWLDYKAIDDRANVVKVMTEARQYVPHDPKVWDKLIEEAANLNLPTEA